MGVKFSAVPMKNPQKRDESPRYYALAQARSTVDINYIADEIAYSSSLTEGDVLNVLRGLIKITQKHLADGDIVSLGDFGTFQLAVSTKTPTDNEKDFTAQNINKAHIRFRPGVMLNEVTSSKHLTFEKTVTVKARREAEKKLREEKDSPEVKPTE